VRFRGDLHDKALNDYFAALERLVVRVGALDDPAAHPFGKRVTEGLDQALPQDAKRAAIEATLSGAANGANRIATCADAPDSAFEPQPDRLLAESRRFFGDPIQPAELAAAWNRRAVDAMALQPASYTELVPGPYLWAALEGLGRLELCLAQFRPEAVAFTRDKGPAPDTLLGTTFVGAELEVRFLPEPGVARAAGLPGDGRTVVARFSADRACTFGYRNDNEPCSRAQCLPELAPLLWNDDARAVDGRARCDGTPLTNQLAQSGATADEHTQTPLRAALEDAWRIRQQQRLAQLEADVLRSDEYERASALYLEYYALAGVTLGTYPEGADALGGLFGPAKALAPRDVLADLLAERASPAVVLERIRTRAQTVHESVRTRGELVEAMGRESQFAHLRALAETIARLELASAAYTGR
jgi:hypothetical protein